MAHRLQSCHTLIRLFAFLLFPSLYHLAVPRASPLPIPADLPLMGKNDPHPSIQTVIRRVFQQNHLPMNYENNTIHGVKRRVLLERLILFHVLSILLI